MEVKNQSLYRFIRRHSKYTSLVKTGLNLPNIDLPEMISMENRLKR